MAYRKIEEIFKNEHPYWVGNGFRVKQYFPANRDDEFLERFSPFIVLDYNQPHLLKATQVPTGVDAHPHRGIETVTFVFDGKIEHKDNKGNSGVIESGDIQWMTAGRGILHKEFHEKEYAKNDRILHLVQLWVNLPKKDKMTEPKYQAVKKEQMGKYISQDGNVQITVYAGEVFGVKGAASTFSPINMYKIDIKKGASLTIKEPDDFNTGMLIISGEINVNDDKIANNSDFVLFENDKEEFKIIGLEEHSEILVLSGQPLNEPVVAMGPFAMNTMEEIMQANADFRAGKFGSMNF